MSEKEIKELNLRLERIEYELSKSFKTNVVNDNLVKKIVETSNIVKKLEYQTEKEKIKQRIEQLTDEKKKIEKEILCLNDSIMSLEHRYYSED